MTFDGTVYVARPDAIDPSHLVAQMRRAPFFRSIAIHGQAGTDIVEDAGASECLEHAAHQANIPVALWVTLDLDHAFDLEHAGNLTKTLVAEANGAYAGIVINAERIAPEIGPYLDELEPLRSRALAWSTLPTFEMGEVARRLDRGGAILQQQAYAIENGVTVRDAVSWANRPPLYIGWWYRAKVLGRSVRGQIVGQDFRGYLFKENGNTWGLADTQGRAIFNRKRLNVVGGLLGLWAPDRVKPTIRTTPNAAGGYPAGIDPEVARIDVKAAGDPRVGLFLGETTPAMFWDTYQ